MPPDASVASKRLLSSTSGSWVVRVGRGRGRGDQGESWGGPGRRPGVNEAMKDGPRRMRLLTGSLGGLSVVLNLHPIAPHLSTQREPSELFATIIEVISRKVLV